MSPDQSTEWAYRLQARAGDALDLLVAAMLDAQRLLGALPSAAPQDLSTQLSRYWQSHAPGAYQQLADGGVRYLSRLALVAATYGSEWLRDALPQHRLAEIGLPPPVPAAPSGIEPMQWTGWYVLCAAWSAQQQAWTGRALQALREEVAAGRVGDDAIQASAQRFLQDRLPDYLGDVAEVGMDLVSAGLTVADDSIQTLAATVLGHQPAPELTVDLSGPAGAVASAELAIENNRDGPADVECTAEAAGNGQLTVRPDRFSLPPGATRRVRIEASVPGSAGEEPVLVGRVHVTGHGDAPLTVRVRAAAVPARRRISVRTLGPVPPDAG